ncbi:hypothetical protein [Coraliomargarita parva]|uniref:hypothetical protein n=1 Tax=Coraliomargarita parva TaxID=3014050 RepID=UPI0022B593B3|nr:hypothetical protein [Coraliomargarita parva]
MNSDLRLLYRHASASADFTFHTRKFYRSRNLFVGAGGAGEVWPEDDSPSLGTQLAAGLRRGLQASNDAKWPGLVVVCIIALVVASYYAVPATGAVFDRIMAWKAAYGAGFSFFSMGIAGGILPVLLGLCTGLYRWGPKVLQHAAYGLLVFGILGVLSDGLYVFQTHLFGEGAGAGTVLSKIAFDQFVWTVLFANPYQLIVLLFRDSGFRWQRMSRSLNDPLDYYLSTGVPALFNNWCFWIPLTGLIYALPSALQIPVASLAVAFWVLLLTLTMKQGES